MRPFPDALPGLGAGLESLRRQALELLLTAGGSSWAVRPEHGPLSCSITMSLLGTSTISTWPHSAWAAGAGLAAASTADGCCTQIDASLQHRGCWRLDAPCPGGSGSRGGGGGKLSYAPLASLTAAGGPIQLAGQPKQQPAQVQTQAKRQHEPQQSQQAVQPYGVGGLAAAVGEDGKEYAEPMNLTGVWIKDRERSTSMDDAMNLMRLNGIVRQAVKLVRGVRIDHEPENFTFTVFSFISWFKVKEVYPMNGEQRQLRRRDLRRGKALGWVEPHGQHIRVNLQWTEPLGGHGTDHFRLISPNELHIESVLEVNGQTARYLTIYNRKPDRRRRHRDQHHHGSAAAAGAASASASASAEGDDDGHDHEHHHGHDHGRHHDHHRDQRQQQQQLQLGGKVSDVGKR